MRGLTFTTVLLALLFYGPVTVAQADESPTFFINGFGTIGTVHSDEKHADFVSDFFDPEGSGHSSDFGIDVDSRFGLQLTSNLSSKVSVVAQVVTEQQYDNSWQPHVEWANIKYQINPDFYIRIGRIVLPGVLASEYRRVGYAQPWVRPPLEVYGIEPVTNNDGVDIAYDFRLGNFNNTLQFVVGQKDIDLPEAGEIQIRDVWGITGTVQRTFLTLHASYEHASITVDFPEFNQLFNGFRQFGPQGTAIANHYEAKNKSVDFLGLGVSFEPENWFLMGEWSQLDSNSFIGKRQGWYVSGGYRLGPITPYATLSRVDVDSTTSTGLPTAGLPPPLAMAAQGLNAGLNSALNAAPRQETLSLGFRWDFYSNVALKLQYDHIDLAPGSQGFLINEQPAFNPGGTVNLYSATLDFVF
jgi:hypothetical protein